MIRTIQTLASISRALSHAKPRAASLFFATALLVGPNVSHAQSGNWVGTWAASPMAAKNEAVTLGNGSAGTTYREIVHVSLGGSTVRVILSNEFGIEPLQIDAVQAAPRTTGNAIAAGSGVPLTFGGRSSVSIPAGALVVSDPATLKLPAFSDLAVSLFLPTQTLSQITRHGFADTTSYIADGNLVSAATLDTAKPIYSWDFLKGVDVQGSGTGAIVTFGDSITDGALSTRDANARWPDVLAKRLAADRKTAGLGILNQGIGGNRLLHDGTGPSALARFDRDVLSQTGVRYVVILEGINDIGHAADPGRPYDVITADDLKFALSQMIDRAHAHGIKVIGATLTPYGKARYSSPAGEALRQAENDFIRNSGKFDGVIDFEKLTADPANPSLFLPAYDSGDSLHPKDAGYKAMGDGIDLKLFEK